MATVLPVRLQLRLPPGWVQADPDEAGEPWSAFVAGHPDSMEGNFAAKITIAGEYRPDSASLGAIALASASIRGGGNVSAVQVVERREVGTANSSSGNRDTSPSLVQTMRLVATIKGTEMRLIQTQVLLAIRDRVVPRKRVVVMFALTTTPRQYTIVIRHFEAFLRTVRPGG
jgi:hypothetical protein